jgi:hypothetical protein
VCIGWLKRSIIYYMVLLKEMWLVCRNSQVLGVHSGHTHTYTYTHARSVITYVKRIITPTLCCGMMLTWNMYQEAGDVTQVDSSNYRKLNGTPTEIYSKVLRSQYRQREREKQIFLFLHSIFTTLLLNATLHQKPKSYCNTRNRKPASKLGVHKSQGQVAVATKFCTAAPDICGSSIWNLLHVILLAPRILR